uniref:Uncharacterized protein n=1 Tax=Spumella elongata TaxID=89044 RepID=A0A7S3MCG8_9STRA|mmetsp:Transcript_54606/g.95471  ORF Transcript_54606/g.95471 Transcript_54606/m.95471 type:complete len:542 (+) Transcript_54606:59-1684(+)
MKKWFKDAITFSCTSCGKCCKTKGSNRVYLNLAESEVMASHLGLSLEAFHETYTDNRLDKNGLMLKSIKQHETKKQCTFLDGNKCSIYEARPTQCKTYPFWPQNMIGPAEWIAESHMCEGIKVTKKLNEISLRLPTSASATNFVKRGDDSVIALNMLAHQIHDRGRGENWTYEQSIELLRLTKKESPELLDDYLDTFYDSNESRIEYESANLRVVDTRTVSHDDVDESDDNEGVTGSEDEEAPVQFTRRMEFVSSPQLAQTEISFAVSSDEWMKCSTRQSASDYNLKPRFDFLSLHMPVHKVLGELTSRVLLRNQAQPNKQHSVAVIGAGCCALPAYLLSKFPTSVVVHAVEPAAEVLQVADSLFDMAQFPPDRLCRHVMDGATFLAQDPGQRFDVVIIDAFESAPVLTSKFGQSILHDNGDGEDDDDGVPPVYAPPASFLDTWTDWAQALSMPPAPSSSSAASDGCGVLLVNVFGPEAWIQQVQQRIKQSDAFASVRRIETLDEAQIQTLGSADSRNVVLAAAIKPNGELFDSFELRVRL